MMDQEPQLRRRRREPGEEPEFPASTKRRYRWTAKVKLELPPVDLAWVRARAGLSQGEFAHRFGLPVGTLRHWEQGTRRPRGAALAFLHVIAHNPAVATRAIMRVRRETVEAKVAAAR